MCISSNLSMAFSKCIDFTINKYCTTPLTSHFFSKCEDAAVNKIGKLCFYRPFILGGEERQHGNE